jgi:hypothetical protein
MNEQPNTNARQRRGFASPLQKAQAGKIGGGAGRDAPIQEPPERSINTPAPEAASEKTPREENYFRQTVWMPRPLNRRLKVHIAKTKDQSGEDISGLINRLVEEYLDKMED